MSNLTRDPAALEAVLAQLSVADTSTIKKAEATLKPFLKNASCLPALTSQLQSSANEQVRYMAAVLLKQKINSHFSKCSQADRTNLKNGLINLLVSEPTKVVRVAVAGVIATLAKNVLSTEQNWPELFGLLEQLVQHADPGYRGLCFSLLGQLVQHVIAHLKPHTGVVCGMYCRGFGDTDPDVVVAAMDSAAAFVSAVADDSELMQLAPMIPPMLTIMGTCVGTDHDEVIVKGLDVLQECAANDQPLINEFIPSVVPFLLGLLTNDKCERGVREAAGQTLLCLIEYRPKFIAKSDLVKNMLLSLVQVIAKSNASGAGSLFVMEHKEVQANEEEDDEDDDMVNQQLAQTILDSMAINIPSKYFTDTALGICSQCLASADNRERKAGAAVLGIVTEGCRDALSTILPNILAGILPVCGDADVATRECAWFALGQLSEHCTLSIVLQHQIVVPAVLRGLEDPADSVKLTTCYVIDKFVEALDVAALLQYLPHLMQRLITILGACQDRNVQELALTAIASSAVSAEMEFLPYAETTCHMLQQILLVSEPALFQLRGRGLECLGHVAVAIGKDNFTRYFEMGMNSAMQGIQLNDLTLKEQSFIYFANCAKVMGNHFDQYLPEMVPFLSGVVLEPELSPFEDAETQLAALGADEDDDDDEDGNGDKYLLNTNAGFVDTKKAALVALGALAEHTKKSFFPYLEKVLNEVILEENGALNSYHDAVRSEALVILEFMLQVACDHQNMPTAPKHVAVPLDKIVTEVARVVLVTYVAALQDVEKLPVSSALNGICGVLELIGVAGLSITSPESNKPIGETLVAELVTLLQEKAPCQKINKHEGHHTGEDDDDDDHDNVVMDSVCDCIGQMAKSAGPAFVPYYKQMHKHLLKFTKSSRAFTDRAMAIGCIAEVMNEIGGAAVSEYMGTILPLIQSSLQDSMEAVRRNAAFCLGAMCEAMGSALAPQFPMFLQLLRPLCDRPPEQLQATGVGGGDIDNALSAVARMIRVAPDAIPLAQVVPVMVNALPLRVDMVEASNVFGTLIDLVLKGNPAALSVLPQIITHSANLLSPSSQVEDEAKVLVITGLKRFATDANVQPAFNAAMGQITDANVRALVEKGLQHA